MGAVTSFLNTVNLGMNYLVTVLFLSALGALVIWYTFGRIRSYGKKGGPPGRGLFLGIMALVEAAIFAAFILLLPVALAQSKLVHGRIEPTFFRWILLYLSFPTIIYLITRKHSGERGFYTALIILTIALFGWFYERWIGILFISLPIYALLLHLTYRLAQVILPASDPDDQKEYWSKFRAFFFYLLGVQYPFWVVGETASREIEMRIPGDYFRGFFEPGTVWMRPHQVVGISAGIEFNQVEGPGILFTKTYDRPVAVADLRTQLRTCEVDATTRDGIPVRAVLFASFAIDREDWPKKGWRPQDLKRLEEDGRTNPLLAAGLRLDRQTGSFPYSTARVKSVLSTAGVDASTPDGVNGVVYWDEWALKQVENATRQVLSERTVDELWLPQVNRPGASALDEMAAKIKELAEPSLRRAGITLFTGRVVNFSMDENSHVRKQQIETWKTIWAQRITAAKADADAARQEEIEKAHAYAKSEILDAIADSIEKARTEHKDLPRHVIALYYIHALEEIIKKQPSGSENGQKEAKERLDIAKQLLLYNQ